ncbi:zinc finger (C3HC4-type RING finger) family protein [Raphanus sativus]|uniref:RBR-type E3 ubiquitin transferase n=1 Tax=Raphanus sativus TaxID=3726 RepID=A0A6J0JN92_RAPSA|nr:E3 ubiquitin-protein ligase RSL1 [Raphanus sativus]KAJ4890523.1 zinc finger (C3HC4-type RING finger) family protein [Raphanus sativus]
MAAIEDHDDVSVILEEQREEIMAAKTLARDHDLAFNLQMQEALAVSRAAHTSSSSSSPQSPKLDFADDDDEGFDYTSLILEDIARVDQERRDREFGAQEMKRLKLDLDRRIHDQRFAKEIMNIPDADWTKDGDFFHKPYSLGSASSSSSSSSVDKVPAVEGECFRVYCKGLVSEEMIGETRVTVGGVGVAICDSADNLIWEVSKVLGAEESKSPEIAELEAIVRGLDEALNFDLGSVTFFIDDFKLFNYVTGRVEPRQSGVATLVNQVSLLQKKFPNCQPSLLTRNDVKFVFKLARDAIVSQIKWPEETSQGEKTFKETCVICYEGITVDKMFSVDGCFHRFCFSCMKQHVEVKLLGGNTATCPSEGCKSQVKMDSCAKFLDPKLVEVMIQRKKEGSISVSDKVYCPYPTCSELMAKDEVFEYTKQYFVGTEQSAARKCMKCGLFFCMQCKVPWHYKDTCENFSKSKRYQNAGDGMLKSLAQSKRWRQCIRCNNMVELASGCFHITCRCGYEFCYTCGAEWKEKKPTCACPIWTERNIIRRR